MTQMNAADIARSMAGTPYINRRLTKAIKLQEAIDEIKYTHGGFLWRRDRSVHDEHRELH